MNLRWLAVLPVMSFACAGASPTTTNPTGETATQASNDERGAANKPSGPRRVSCDDGSCFACGEATCMSGYYCRATPTAHGCGWSRACATKPSCACLAPTLKDDPGCTCEEREGGVYVLCDGARL